MPCATHFLQRLTHIRRPDGVAWKATLTSSSPLIVPIRGGTPRVLGVLPGDHLVAISVDGEHYEPINSAGHVQMYLDEAGVGGNLHYLIERLSYPKVSESRFGYIELYNLQPVSNLTARDFYINFIGVVTAGRPLRLFRRRRRALRHHSRSCSGGVAFHSEALRLFEDLVMRWRSRRGGLRVVPADLPPILRHLPARPNSRTAPMAGVAVYARGVGCSRDGLVTFVPPRIHFPSELIAHSKRE